MLCFSNINLYEITAQLFKKVDIVPFATLKIKI